MVQQSALLRTATRRRDQATQAQARWRDRVRHRRVVLQIEIELDKVADALLTSGRLSESEAWRRQRLEEEISRLVDQWAREQVRR
jgi:hypothetical protein